VSIELLNGVSNVDGKRRVSASMKETGVNVDGKRWVSSLRWAHGYLTCMNVSVVKRKNFTLEREYILYPSQRITFSIPNRHGDRSILDMH